MREHTWTRLGIWVAVVSCLVLMGPSDVLSYDRYRRTGGAASCSDCHAGFLSQGPLHEMHVGNSQMTNTCTLCHVSIGDIPWTYQSGAGGGQGCRGCHGVNNQTEFGWGTGLRAHHANAGVPPDINGQVCADCHTDPAPSPEPTKPVYYLRSDVNVKLPCSSTTPDGEDWDGDVEGLDNDGDLVYDELDSDCMAVGVGEGAGPVLRTVTVFPNPCGAQGTEIAFELAAGSSVTLGLYDLAGRLVRVERFVGLLPGRQRLPLGVRDDAGKTLPSGTYVLNIKSDGASMFGRLVLLR